MDAADGVANQFASDGVRAFQLALVFEFELAGDGGKRGVNVGDAGDAVGFAKAGSALLGATDHAFKGGNRQALADAGALVHAFVFARLKGDFFNHFTKVLRNLDLVTGIAASPGFLRGDGHAFFDGRRIVRAYFRADPVF